MLSVYFLNNKIHLAEEFLIGAKNISIMFRCANSIK